MSSSFWEEQTMPMNLLACHQELIKDMNIPEWIREIVCPHCKKVLPLSSIREIGLKFNTRNIGDIVVEIMCNDCRKLETLYFTKAVDNVKGFQDALGGQKPSAQPITEDEMYKQKYNNVLEKMANKYNKGR